MITTRWLQPGYIEPHVLLGHLCLVLFALCPYAVGQAPDIDPRLVDEPYIEKGSPQAWALATDAMHSRAQGAGLDRLCWGSPTRRNVEDVRTELREGPWKISNREEVLAAVEFTRDEGYSLDFRKLGEYLVNASAEDRRTFISEYAGNPAKLDRIQLVLEHYPRLKTKGLQGWDLTRCIALCRRAYTAGYLERQETWDLIMPLARQLQSTFDSWEDLGANYLLGRRYWSKERADLGNGVLKAQMDGLLKDERSDWRTIPWSLDLKQADAVAPRSPIASPATRP